MPIERRENEPIKQEQPKNGLVSFVKNDAVVKRLAFANTSVGIIEMLALNSSISSESLTRVFAVTIISMLVGAGYQLKDNIEKSKPQI